MTEIPIDVNGSATTRHAPERATVHAAVTADGPEHEPVVAHVTEAVREHRGTLQALLDSGAITSLAIDQVRTGVHRPWNERGKQLPLIHTATVSITAQFRDFAALGRWALSESLTVHGITWDLTDETRTLLERQVRQEALHQASLRAQDYADALGLGGIEVRAIRDPGTVPNTAMLMAGAAMREGGDSLDLEPEPVEVSAQVHATFAVQRRS